MITSGSPYSTGWPSSTRIWITVPAHEVIEAARLAGAHEMILGFNGGYDRQLELGGRGLSAGQAQRIALARAVMAKHAFRNALIPVLTVVGLAFAILLGGAVVTETVFGIPGVGRLIVQSVMRRDYLVIQGAVLVIAAVYVLINLLVDLLYVLVDPRVKY